MVVPRPNVSDPVSVAITRHVKPGQVEVFEAWLDEIKAAAAELFESAPGGAG